MPKTSQYWTTVRTLSSQVGESATPAAGVFVAVNGVDENTVLEYHLDGMSVTGAPSAITFQVWRYTGGKIDALETASYTPAQLAAPLPIRSVFNSLNTWVTVSFTGGTSPAISGTIMARPVSDSSFIANSQAVASAAAAQAVKVIDPTSGSAAQVTAFHASDNQQFTGTVYGIMTGGVAQLVNFLNGLDRQRETGGDNIPAVGVAAGTAQLKSPISTTVSSGGGAGSTAVTLAATKFTNRGAAAWVQPGSILCFEPGTTNQEYAYVTAVNYGTNVVTVFGLGTGNGLKNTHANASAVTTAAYNEARDATAPDGSTGAGFAAGATYLFNQTLNASAGGWEGERSFSGELAYASGTGAAIAVEYEDTAGGPLLASGVPSGLRLMPAQGLQGKGRSTSSVTTTTAGDTVVTFPSAAATKTVLAGWPLRLSGGASPEYVLTSQSWTPGSAAAVPIQSPVVNTGQTTAAWSSFAVDGPGLNGFNPEGLGLEEECVYDPVTNLYYVERSATQDGVSAQNVVMEGPALWNGATMDRAYSASAANLGAQQTKGAALVMRPGDWAQQHSPAFNTQATTTKAAGGAGVRNVCTSISITLFSDSTGQSGLVVFNLRDGASGAGTILWSMTLSLPAAAFSQVTFPLSNLNIVGSANTAMTLETSAAPGVHAAAVVAMTGCQAA